MFKWFLCLILSLGLTSVVGAMEFVDHFDQPHDYLSDGVGGTGWDGFIGQGVGEAVSVLDASMSDAGCLRIGSSNGRWEPDWSPRGPFLYKVAEGDFTASVKVVDSSNVNWNVIGLAARVEDLGAGGSGEDFECVEFFNVIDKNIGRSVNNGSESEWGHTGLAHYLRLRREGNLFYHEISHDGTNWTLLSGSPKQRDDLAGLPLQVGIQQATYTSSDGYGVLDDFELTYFAAGQVQAFNPSPANQAVNVSLNPTLLWMPGSPLQASDGHVVYIGLNEQEVDDAEAGAHPNVDQYIVSSPTIDFAGLADETTYYWRVDQVDGDTVTRGSVWSFTTSSPFASEPEPLDGAVDVPVDTTLSWTSGNKVQASDGHVVYVGTDRAAVEEAEWLNQSGVDVYVADDAAVGLAGLDYNTSYFWRVDEVNGEQTWKGPVWSFTTRMELQGNSFSDDFSIGHDYLAEGVDGTPWDGLIEEGKYDKIRQLQATGGKLYLKSKNTRWDAPWIYPGPFLYSIVESDFKVTVRVTSYQSVNYNGGGLMVRAAEPGIAGNGENWVSMDYFPLFGCGNFARMADNNVRTEVCHNSLGGSLASYMQIEKMGSFFYMRYSHDGQNWEELACSPIQRADLMDIPLQVGIFQASYTNTECSMSFDDYELSVYSNQSARIFYPEDGQSGVAHTVSLSWGPGAGAQYHDVYFSDDHDEALTADNTQSPGSGAYQGRQDVTELEYEVTGLQDGRTYYWRVDEVIGDQIVKGDVWSFVARDRSLESFNDYASSTELNEVWIPGGSAVVTLSTEMTHSGAGALRMDYDNGGSDVFAQVRCEFETPQDWFSSDQSYRSICVYFKGDPGNGGDRFYAVFRDGDWGTEAAVVPYDGDPENLRTSQWNRWDIDLSRIVECNNRFRLSDVVSIGFAMGDPTADVTGGSGTIWLDNVVIHYQRCNEKNRLMADFDGDCRVGFGDLSALAGGWLDAIELTLDTLGDGGTNIGDFRLMARDWQQDYPSWPRYVQPEKFITPVPYRDVTVTGGLWKERMDVNRTVSLPHVWDRCEYSTKNGVPSMRLDNFRKAAGEKTGGFTGLYFNDSDVYKIIEGTGYSLCNHPDPVLQAYVDDVIDSIDGAQWDDGYLYTYYSLPHKPLSRWNNVRNNHELYCAGHLIEGAIAYAETTGDNQILDVAIDFADYICEEFGPGKRLDPPGHQEIELALVKLYRKTGDEKYLNTAKFFIDERGNSGGHNLYGTYSQDHVPFVDQEEGVGHSVRAMYMYCGATDIAMILKDEAYANAVLRLWDNIVAKKTYITGGIGQPGGPEGFMGDYELGNNSYCETCSGIAFALWNHRLYQMSGDAKHLDCMERTLLNNMLGSLSQGGNEHFYTNPLITHSGRLRWEWPSHDCACCPSNLVRVIASIGGYAYGKTNDGIQVNMYLPGDATVALPDNDVVLSQASNYPWDGDITINVDPAQAGEFTIHLRIPGWARNIPLPGNLYKYINENSAPVALAVNGQPVEVNVEKNLPPSSGFGRPAIPFICNCRCRSDGSSLIRL